MKNPLPITGFIQRYEWGGVRFIPSLLGTDNPDLKPFAELWLGSHPKGMSKVHTDAGEVDLDRLIAADPGGLLGPATAKTYHNRLPFLFKVLDVRKMLSIQAHPTKAEAEAGFRRENEEGIPPEASNRIYKDDNHKPEAMVALTDFWLLHGFKTDKAIAEILSEVSEFRALSPFFVNHDIRTLYRHIMEMPQEEVDRMLGPLQHRLQQEVRRGPVSKDHPDYWAFQAFEDYTREGHFDRGIFSIYLFNLVRLYPGEGIYQDAGIPHAYLEGVNVELMANSDNVFRGGLTPKHIDVPELLAHLGFEPVVPRVIQAVNAGQHESAYPTPAPDFALSVIDLKAGELQEEVLFRGPAIYLVLEGRVSAGNRDYGKGEAFIAFFGAEFGIRGKEDGRLFKATVG